MDDFDSATYSIESEPDRKRVSLDDVILPTVRRSAIQIVSLSPRRQSKRPVPMTTIGADNSTMQVTKLVLKTPPGSPKRQPKAPGIIIKSIQTLAGPGLTGGSDLERECVVPKTNSVLTENRNLSIPASDDPASYRIVPILSPQNKDMRKEFEVRRTERERATNDFQDFLRESFKENKTPPSTPPPLSSVPVSSSAIEVIRISDKGSSDADSTSMSVLQLKSTVKTGIQKTAKEEIRAINYETQRAVPEIQLSSTTKQAIADPHAMLVQTRNHPETVLPSNETIATESINPPQGEASGTTSIIVHPPQSENQESHVTVELEKPPPSNAMRPKPISKAFSSATKSAVVEDTKKKEKSYDPAKAREFMKEQQAKRRLEKKEAPVGVAGSCKGAVEKDLIKQRLETLRKSSQKLVSKNLQKARKRSVSCAPKESANGNKHAPSGKMKEQALVQCNDRTSSVRPTMGLRKFASTPTLRLVKTEKSDLKPANAPKPKPAVVQTKEFLPNVPKPPSAGSRDSDARTGKDSSSSRSANPSTTSTISKPSFKIGIMRKPDNLSLDDIAQQSPLKGSQSVSIPPGRGKVNAQLIVINADQDVEEPTKEAEKELKLQVPDVMLVPTNASTLPVNQQHESAVIPADLEENDTPMIPQSLPVKSIPPWLKQSLRQPDPYPFILAVRKKLEAVQTVREEKNKPTNNQEQNVMQQLASSRYNSYMNEIESVPIIRKKPATDNRHKEANATNKQSSGSVLDNGGSSIVTKISPYSSPNTTSEISSIKSDIALPLPPLLSSTKIEKPAGQFCPTPTSGPISPLSMDKISQMKVATPGQTSTIKSPNRSVEIISNDVKKQEKARPLSPPRPHVAVQQSLNMSHMDRSQKELEYQRLLESFNRSLTHVIEVNQQLYSALKNVPAAPAIPPFPQDVLRIRDEMTQTSLPIPRIPLTTVTDKVDSDPQSGKASEATTTTASNYSDDFEHQSQTEAPPLPEQTHHDIVAASPASSPTTSSASTSSSSSANSSARSDSSDSNTKSSSQSSTSSSFDHDREASPRRVQNRPETNATDDERKATSNTTTAHSSDFDSRSFSLSDSHNNTTNNHPPMPEEYLPSFEESLRKNQHSVDKQHHELIGQRKDIQPGQKEISRESSISEEIQPSQGEERSFSFKHSENANDLKVNSVPLITSSSEESLLKNESQAQSNRDSLAYMENADATINSDLLAAMFNRTDLEVSILSTTVSETNLSYSSIGMFDQLIQSERSKEDHLVSRVHSKQKALLNRAKGQLAWLELQKQRYREKGMTDQITAIKKKQRAILLRLQKDRTELNRALKSSTESSRTMTANDPVLTSKMVDSKLNSYCSSPVPNNSGSFTLRKSSSNIRIARHQHSHTPEDANRKLARTTTTTSNSIQIAIRGRELEPNDRLEDILLRREEELRKRKEHVQRLLEWHRKLEREEEQLIAVEDRLLAYNTRKLEPANTSRQEMTLEERVQRIEKSLKTLQSIPTTVARKDDDGTSVTQEHDERYSQMSVKGSESEEEIVLTGGSKLNRFWYRLTGIEEQRYKPGRNYPITRLDMETLFEEAKRCVLSRFESKDNHLKEALLEQSIKIIPRKGNEADANTTVSVEDTGSLQSTAVGEETVRTVEQLGEDEVVGTETHDTVTIITNETTETEHSEAVNQEEPNATSSELPPMEEDEKCLLSSTVNGWSPGSRKSIESVEFHTLEETTTQYQSTVGNEQDATVEEEPIKSESYSITFEDQSVGDVEAGEEGQQLIEDMSLPPMLLNNTSLNIDSEDSESTSSCESSATVELSVPLVTEEKVLEELTNQDGNDLDAISSDTSISIAQSLEEASESSSISNVTTPTTVTPTLGIETIDNQDFPDAHLFQEDDRKDDVESISPAKSPKMALETSGNSYEDEIFHTKSSSTSAGSAHGITSELAKRLATLHDELEELSETLERTPLMKSPVTAVSPSGTKSDQLEDQNSSEETITFDYDEDGDGVTPPSADLTKDQDGTPSNDPTVSLNSAKIEVKLRSKVMGSSDTIAIVSGSNSVYNRDYPTPSQQLYHHQLQNHQQEGMSASSSAAPNLGVRMPDIINEAEVLRRQQLQIEQEIKELEQQVGFFREIPNKPPPPYIPPANGSPLALLFPSETRIDELIDGRVEELHRDRIAPENLLSDHVTNVYEKLILDMCKELYHDLRPADPTVSFRTIPHDKRPLVFHNPPDALRCMKDYLRVKIRRVLNDAQLALQQQQHQHQQHQLLLHHQLQQQHQQQHPHLPHAQLHHHALLHHGHCTATMPFLYGNGCASKRKPDQVDEILKQETHDDDARWTNFDREEIEVKDRITDELLKSLLAEALHDMVEAHERKGKDECLIQRQESAM